MKVQVVIGGKTYEVEYDPADGIAPPSSSTTPPIDRTQSVVLPTPQTQIPGTEVDEAKVLRSPVSGIVTRINVAPGESLKTGDAILVVEAMKMENNLDAVTAAKVKSVTVRVGDSVKAGQILATFE